MGFESASTASRLLTGDESGQIECSGPDCRRNSTVDEQAGAGDEGRRRPQQKLRGRGDVVRCADASHTGTVDHGLHQPPDSPLNLLQEADVVEPATLNGSEEAIGARCRRDGSASRRRCRQCCTWRVSGEGSAVLRVDDALADDEVAEGYILTCQGRPDTSSVAVPFE